MNILVVDDSAMLRQRVVHLLSRLENIQNIAEASGLKEGLEKVRVIRPDVVILDIRMSDGNGIDLLKEIKKNYPQIRVIMLSNFSYEQYRKSCLEAGADLYLDKSTEFEKLVDAVRQISA